MLKRCIWCKEKFETRYKKAKLCSRSCVGKYARSKNKTLQNMGWSLKYAQCQKCGTTERPHECRGMCRKCYLAEDDQRTRGIQYYYKNKEEISKKEKIKRKSLTKEQKRRMADNVRRYENGKRYGGNWFKVKERANHKCEKCGITEKEHLDNLGFILSVHHIDKNKLNNNMDNLICLCSKCHTIIHDMKGEKSHRSKLTTEEVKEIKKLKDKKHRLEVAEKYNVNERTIRSIWDGTNWKHIK